MQISAKKMTQGMLRMLLLADLLCIKSKHLLWCQAAVPESSCIRCRNRRISQLTKNITHDYKCWQVAGICWGRRDFLHHNTFVQHPPQAMFQVFKSWLSGHSWEVLALLDEAWLVPQRKNKYSCIRLSTALLCIPTLFSKSDHCFP